jgi:hypothetical protein
MHTPRAIHTTTHEAVVFIYQSLETLPGLYSCGAGDPPINTRACTDALRLPFPSLARCFAPAFFTCGVGVSHSWSHLP